MDRALKSGFLVDLDPTKKGCLAKKFRCGADFGGCEHLEVSETNTVQFGNCLPLGDMQP